MRILLLVQLIAAYAVLGMAFQWPFQTARQPYQKWNEYEMKQFLRDNDVKVDEHASKSDLMKLAKQTWNDLENKQLEELETSIQDSLKSQWSDYPDSYYEQLKETISNTLRKTGDYVSDAYDDASNWAFSGWSDTQLKKLLDSAKVKYDKSASTEDLMELAKQNYKKLASSYKGPKYLASWAYNSWSMDDLQKWLDEHGVKYNKGGNKESYVSLVQKNILQDYLSQKKQKQNWLSKLKLSDFNLLSGDGKSKSLFNGWSEPQIKKWAEAHGLVKSRRKFDIDYLKEHSELFRDDLNSWLNKNNPKAAFEPDLKSMSIENLKEFLAMRDVDVPKEIEKSKDKLIELVEENEYLPISPKNKYASYISSWSTEDLKNWLKEKKQDAEGTREDLIAKVKKMYADVGEETANKAQKGAAQAEKAAKASYDELAAYNEKLKHQAFNTWSESDLKKYLEAFGGKIDSTAGYTREQLADMAKKYHGWFYAASDAASDAASGAAAKATDAAKALSDFEVTAPFESVVKKWPNHKLKSFLDARDVKYPYFASHRTLVRLVTENKMKPVKGDFWDFSSWSTDNLKEWLGDSADKAGETRDQLVNQAKEYYKSFAKQSNQGAEKVKEGYENAKKTAANYVDFSSWSDADLRSYLESFGLKHKETTREQMVRMAKEQYAYFTGSSTPKSKYGMHTVQNYASKASNWLTQWWTGMSAWARGYYAGIRT